MSRAWRTGSQSGWRALRASVLGRDGHRCIVGELADGSHPALKTYLTHLTPFLALLHRAPGCTGRDRSQLQAHHVRGKQATGMDPRWVVTACRECNLGMGNPLRHDPQPMSVTKW